MLLKKNEKTGVKAAVALVAVCLIIAAVLLMQDWQKTGERIDQKEVSQPDSKTTTGSVDKNARQKVVQKPIEVTPEIDYQNLDHDKDLKDLMQERKKELGLDKSLDMVVRSDETFTIGDVRIAMQDILKQAFKKEDKVYEEKIERSGEVRPQKIQNFGIYVVRPGDNIWNIHFNILKEYYRNKGISVAPKADEPGNQGMSSGVGKILKFSETMVIIYNLVEKKVDTNIDLLQPLSKIVVYNMEEVFSLLQEINYENINRIQFDGQTIWIPTEKL